MSDQREHVANTVLRLFREFERRGVNYALLRNRELLDLVPGEGSANQSTDVDLVIESGHLAPGRQAIIAVAEAEGWDVVTECDHWTRSPVRHHHIEVFRLYRLNPLEFLQIDVFHAYLIWGLPLVDERGLLEGSICQPHGFNHVDIIKERTFALLQIYARAKRPAHDKFARYRKRFLQAWVSEQERMRSFLYAKFSMFGERAASALAQEDLGGFVRNMWLAKLYFSLKFALAHPLLAARFLLSRAWEYWLRFHTRQCGFVLRAYASDEGGRELLRTAMEEVTRRELMESWKQQPARSKGIGSSEHIVMEQGGVVIQWSGRQVAQIDVSEFSTLQDLIAEITRMCIERHAILFRREQAAAAPAPDAAAPRTAVVS